MTIRGGGSRRDVRYAAIGYFGTSSGLGVAAGNTVEALESTGREVFTIPISDGASLSPLPLEEHGARVMLYHVNPVPELVDLLFASFLWRERELGATLNVCAPYFELPAVPTMMMPALGGMDAVIAPTAFIGDALRRDLPSVRVLYSPQTALLPEGVSRDRQRFGIPEDAVTFVTSFDYGSDLHRKNPGAAIEAFRSAFPDDPGVCLAVRAKQISGCSAPDGVIRRLLDYAGNDSRIRLIEGNLSYPEVLSLYASGDVYVSLHRSEGLGLGPMEAMSLGKAVIATGWSGNMDFMSAENSMPVAYRLVPVDVPETSIYRGLVPEGFSYWAEPDHDSAVAAMRLLREEPMLREQLGARASEAIARRRETFLRADFADEIEEMASSGYLKSAEHKRHVALLCESLRPLPPSISITARALRKAKGLLGASIRKR